MMRESNKKEREVQKKKTEEEERRLCARMGCSVWCDRRTSRKKRSVGHTRPLPSSASSAGLRVMTAGVTPRAESRSSWKETHSFGREG